MKKIKYYIIPILMLTMLVVSCSDDLERAPFNGIERGDAFNSIEDAENWDNGFYSLLRSRVSGSIQNTMDLQADQLNASLEFGNRGGFPHRWEGFLSTDQTVSDIWARYYSAIKSLNVAIEGFPTIELTDQADIDQLKVFTADAHFARAFYYYNLVLRFSKDYDPATAGTDLGVPLVLTFDIEELPARSSMLEVYNQILLDLQAASTGLAGISGSQGSNYFNADVVKALEARVKLSMEDWAGAKAAADQLINSGTYPLMTTEAALKTMWTNDNPQEVIFQAYVNNPSELTNTNALYLRLNANDGTFTPDFIPSQWVIDMYDDDDIRKNVYFEQKDVKIFGGVTPDIYLVNKYPGNPDFYTTVTNYQNAPKVFRIAEMYLISAEAAAMLPGGDIATPLNALRQARNLPALGAPTFDDVKDERFRELAFEGFRLDDLKRWGEGFTRSNPQDVNLINVGPGYESLTKAAGDDKFTWGIPSYDETINPNIVQNPGW